MRRDHGWRVGVLMLTVLFLSFGVLQTDAWARAGGGRSFGGGSSRSFSTPYRGFSGPAPRNASPSYPDFQCGVTCFEASAGENPNVFAVRIAES
jgi:uncharacterized membrane protein